MIEKLMTEFRANLKLTFSFIPVLLLPISLKRLNCIFHNGDRYMFNSVAFDFGFFEPRIEVQRNCDRDWLDLVFTLSLSLGIKHCDLREIIDRTFVSPVDLTLIPVQEILSSCRLLLPLTLVFFLFLIGSFWLFFLKFSGVVANHPHDLAIVWVLLVLLLHMADQ